MNAKEVIDHLKVRFAPPAYCFLEQVADGTGARQHRWADAIAMSVWPSRGYDIHGIEVKVSKYDWKCELANPAKSAPVQQFCNRWWIATPDDTIIAPGELPPTWGWMVVKSNTMRVVKEAPILTPKPLTVEFVASVLRNVAKAEDNAIEKVRYDAYQKGREEGGEYYQREYRSIKKACEEFEAASGLCVGKWGGGKELGEAVSVLQGLKWQVERIEGAIKACEAIKGMLTQVQELATLKDEIKALSDAQKSCILEPIVSPSPVSASPIPTSL